MSDATSADAGLVSGLVSTTAQVGGALGLAVLATLSRSRTDSLLAGGDSLDVALVGGYQLAFGIGAALMLIAIVLAATVLRRPAVADAGPRVDQVPAPDVCECRAA